MRCGTVRFRAFFVSLSVVALLATGASAGLRVPQVPVLGGGLQSYLNGVNIVGPPINVLTDQSDVQLWVTTINSATFTLMFEISSNAAATSIGLYNAGSPPLPLYQLFPAGATSGWFATASFRRGPTRVVVGLYDDQGNEMGVTTYLGAEAAGIGYYLQGPAGIFYTQDAHNPNGTAQALAYGSMGNFTGEWWLCWEDAPVSGGASDQDYDDTVVNVVSFYGGLPVIKTSWGALKKRFR
jgi:hypothetical protein